MKIHQRICIQSRKIHYLQVYTLLFEICSIFRAKFSKDVNLIMNLLPAIDKSPEACFWKNVRVSRV